MANGKGSVIPKKSVIPLVRIDFDLGQRGGTPPISPLALAHLIESYLKAAFGEDGLFADFGLQVEILTKDTKPV